MKPTSNVTFCRAPGLDRVEACRVVQSCHVFPSHTHAGIYTFFLMEAGASYCLSPNRPESLAVPGAVGLINPGMVHICAPDKGLPLSYWMVYVDVACMQEMADDTYQKQDSLPEFDRLIVEDTRLSGLIAGMVDLMSHPAGRLETDSAFTELMAHLLSCYGRVKRPGAVPGNEHRAVAVAKDVLSENLDRKMTLEEVAKEVGLSRYHFLRVFKSFTGVSPHIFRTLQRIDRAKQLLKQGMRFSHVALETGFSDQSHFTNKFRKYTGATPRQYQAH